VNPLPTTTTEVIGSTLQKTVLARDTADVDHDSPDVPFIS
jgi:hypothetical protein